MHLVELLSLEIIFLNWLAYVARKDKIVQFKVPPSIDYIGGLALGIVYSSDNSDSTGYLYIDVVNRTQRTYFRIRIWKEAIVTASHEYYLWLGNLSNKKLNLKGGDMVFVNAIFFGGDNRMKVNKTGVDIVKWDLSDGCTNWDYYVTMPYTFKEDIDNGTRLSICNVFLCYKTPEAWPWHIEGSESDPLPKFFASALKARKNDITVKTLLTVIEGREGTEFSDGDVLIFPQMIKYRGLKESDVDSFVDDVLVNRKPWASGVQEPWTDPHVFICAHMSRNEWYRVWARNLIDKFKEEVELRGLMNQVFVAACYHTGAHDDNLIIYCPGSDGSITSHWYRFVTPYDVPELLYQHIGKGEIIERHWRGQIGASADEAEKIDDQKLPNGGESKIIKKSHENGNQTMSYVRVPFHFDDENYQTCTDDDDDENYQTCTDDNDDENYQTCITLGQIGASSDEAEEINDRELPNGEENKKIEEKPQENGDQIQNNENFSGCCHGANSDGFTCCNKVSLENGGSEAKKLKETRESCALGKLSSLIGNWEQSDVLAAAAVVGAMASVAVAYIFYKRSSRKML